ncbi:MAG: tRNA uridine-5-carboxymethylaminomethyl(34) synthesis GTPase MnmE [Firmicutes bacterium]|nr:tRNA uridine-5-carboxymethylaminomethyl(34) synthesis GTPase MnmE [Bacillota bacterium]
MRNDEFNDTIVAISTPPGEGGIGIVRFSGNDALAIALKMFVRKMEREKLPGELQKFFPVPRKLYYGYVLDEQGHEIDEVLFSYMPGPHSYTCEDVVEINAHGGAVPLKNILSLALKKGARLADPGEFTKRAYLNGRLDLVQAESILALIRAKTDKALKAALNGLKGALSSEILTLRADIVSLLAQIEVEVDFSYEDPDLETDLERDFAKKILGLLSKIETLLRRRFQGKILQEGLKTVIAGRPNVGKSSLYNYLIREERAIVTEIPGTTRDLLVEYINVRGVPLKLIDTAGLHPAGDEVEKIGMMFSRKAMEEADLLLFMLDASQEISAEDRWIYRNIYQDGNIDPGLIIILNKIDLGLRITRENVEDVFPGHPTLEISLREGSGLEKLEDTISKMVFSGEAVAEGSALLLEARQEELLKKAQTCVEDAYNAYIKKIPPDLISIDLRQAGQYLGEIIGEEISEDILEHIFGQFCIGK